MADQQVQPYYKRAAQQFLHGTNYQSVEAAVYAGKPLEQWLSILEAERQQDLVKACVRYIASGRLQIQVMTLPNLQTTWLSTREIHAAFKAHAAQPPTLRQIGSAIYDLHRNGKLQSRRRKGRILEYAIPKKQSEKPEFEQKSTIKLAKSTRNSPQFNQRASPATAHRRAAQREPILEMQP